jgi:hypothetical protein
VENVAGGLIDLAVRLDLDEDVQEELIDAASGVAERYQALWDILNEQPTFSYDDRYQVEGTIRRLHDLGYAVDEVNLQWAGPGKDEMRLKVAVAARRFHATQLHNLTGLDVGEGQATILLGDFRAYQARLQHELKIDISDQVAAQRWIAEVQGPGMARAWEALGGLSDPIQAYCDLLEVRWLLSEQAGHDVGDKVALDALAERDVPARSSAEMAIVEATTEQLPQLAPHLIGAYPADSDDLG